MGDGIMKVVRVVLGLALIAAVGGHARPLAAQSAGAVTTADFVGAWELIDWRATDQDGNVRFPYGEDAMGQISYSANGRMSAHLMRAPERAGEPAPQYLSYWGGFSIDTSATTVTHHVMGSTQAGFINTDLVREYTFEGDDRLVLRAGTNQLTWRRVR